MVKESILLLLLVTTVLMAPAEQLYVSAKTGADTNSGTKAQPLKTIGEAAKRVNANKEPGATTIILSEGMHLLTGTVLFTNNKYTPENRLVIRAEVMPDDTAWSPQRMPVIVTVAPLVPGIGGEEARGLQMEVSHATIEGLRFTGSPDYSYIDGKNPVVFWKADGGTSNHNAMRYCLVYGCYFSGYTNLAGYGSGPLSGTNVTSTDFLQMENVQTVGTIQIEKDQSKRNYLQLRDGSFGSALKAGLFKE